MSLHILELLICKDIQFGDVVAQLAKARLGEPDCNAAVPGFDPGFLHSLLRGGRNDDCV
jgi:hypothetical protein